MIDSFSCEYGWNRCGSAEGAIPLPESVTAMCSMILFGRGTDDASLGAEEALGLVEATPGSCSLRSSRGEDPGGTTTMGTLLRSRSNDGVGLARAVAELGPSTAMIDSPKPNSNASAGNSAATADA